MSIITLGVCACVCVWQRDLQKSSDRKQSAQDLGIWNEMAFESRFGFYSFVGVPTAGAEKGPSGGIRKPEKTGK